MSVHDNFEAWAGFAYPDRQEEVEELAKTDKHVSDFKYNWRRWDNWAKNPPIVVYQPEACIDRPVVVGFHAAVFQARGPYVNSYYQFTSPAYRGKGYGGMMVDFLLKEARRRGLTRLKFKCPVGDSDGALFWAGFGCRPFAVSASVVNSVGDYWYDIDISGGPSAAGLKSWLVHPRRCWPLEKEKERAKKAGALFL